MEITKSHKVTAEKVRYQRASMQSPAIVNADSLVYFAETIKGIEPLLMLLGTPVLYVTSQHVGNYRCTSYVCHIDTLRETQMWWLKATKKQHACLFAAVLHSPCASSTAFILPLLSGWVLGSLLSQMLAGRKRLHVCHQSGQVTTMLAACHSCGSSGHWRCRLQASTPRRTPRSRGPNGD